MGNDKDKNTTDTQDKPAPQTQQPQANGETPKTYDDWVKTQSEDVQELITENTAGLKSALTSERESRKKFETQVRDLATKAEKGSEAQAELVKVADQAAEADRKADFFEAAHAAGVSNIRLAYIAATKDEMFDKRGNANFEKMREQYPELFGGTPAAPAGNAGTGTQKPPGSASTMNDAIRAMAGR